MTTQFVSRSYHPFPYKLSINTTQKLHAIFLFIIITDQATFLHFSKSHDAYQEFIDRAETVGITKQSIDEAWPDFQKYMDGKPEPKIQQIIFHVGFGWDKFLNDIKPFILDGNKKMGFSFSKGIEDLFKRLDKYPANEILGTFETAFPGLDLSNNEKNSVSELSLLRNLGVHNDWEVDAKYLQSSLKKEFPIGLIRDVPFSELLPYYGDWLSSLGKISKRIAIFYKDFYDSKYD